MDVVFLSNLISMVSCLICSFVISLLLKISIKSLISFKFISMSLVIRECVCFSIWYNTKKMKDLYYGLKIR